MCLRRRNGGLPPLEDPVKRMHRHLEWALFVATAVLIVNVLAVITFSE